MPTLNGTMPRDRGREFPCIWCGDPTDITFEPAGMPELGAQPMHLLCGAALIRAYQRWLEGRVLSDRDQAGLRRLADLRRRLSAGH